MKTITVVFDSKYGHTEQMARAIGESITQAGVEGHVINVREASRNWKLLSGASAIIFGSPTYFGSVSAEFKFFMESSSFFFSEQKWKNKFAAGFTCSSAASGDKLATLFQLSVFAAQHGMHWVNLGVGPAGNPFDADSETNLNRFGCWMGAVGQPGKDSRPGATLPRADFATAQHLGRRVAETVLRFS